MNFEAIKKYAVFSGRASRTEYWHFILLNLVLIVLATLADITGTLGAIVALVFLLPGLAVSVRRLHDIGKSGWWYLIVLIPLVGQIIVLVWFCTRGTHGVNQFGADPLSIKSLTHSQPNPKNLQSDQNSANISDKPGEIGQHQKADDEGIIGEEDFQSEKDDIRNGEGSFTWTCGATYIGNWSNNRMHGQGNLTYADGSRYLGEWNNGKSNGQGTFSWANGAQHTGDWTDGKRNGQGIHTYANGTIIRGIWKDGKKFI